MEIRTATPEEYGVVKALIDQGVEEGALKPRRKKELKKSIKKERVLLAVVGEEAIGTIGVSVYDRRISEVRSFYVAPNHRDTGVGRELVGKLLEQPVSVLPSGTIFAISATPHSFERQGFSPQQGASTIVFKRI